MDQWPEILNGKTGIHQRSADTRIAVFSLKCLHVLSNSINLQLQNSQSSRVICIPVTVSFRDGWSYLIVTTWNSKTKRWENITVSVPRNVAIHLSGLFVVLQMDRERKWRLLWDSIFVYFITKDNQNVCELIIFNYDIKLEPVWNFYLSLVS